MGSEKPTPTDVIVLSIELKSGRFKMQLQHPIFDHSTEKDFRDSVEAWLALSMQALKSGATEMDAVIKEPPHA